MCTIQPANRSMHGTRQDPNSKPSQDASGTGPAWLVILSIPCPLLFSAKAGKAAAGAGGDKSDGETVLDHRARPPPSWARVSCSLPSTPVRPRPAGWGGARPCRGPWGKRETPSVTPARRGPAGPPPHPCVHRKRTSRTCQRSARTHRRTGPGSDGPHRQRDRIGAPL
jgi:hypothetical protein